MSDEDKSERDLHWWDPVRNKQSYNEGSSEGRLPVYWSRVKPLWDEEEERRRELEKQKLRSCGTNNCMLHLSPPPKSRDEETVPLPTGGFKGKLNRKEDWNLGFDNDKDGDKSVARAMEQHPPAWGWGSQCMKQFSS